MKLNKKVKARMIKKVMPLLPPGTQVRQIMYTQTRGFGGMLLALFPDRYGMIAVADDAIFIFDCGRSFFGVYGVAKPKTLMGTVPRGSYFGRLTGLSTKVIFASPWRIVRGYYDEARTADLEAPRLQTA